MRSYLPLFATLAVALSACSEQTPTAATVDPLFAKSQTTEVTVTTDSDAGAGSFRAAIEAANADLRPEGRR